MSVCLKRGQTNCSIDMNVVLKKGVYLVLCQIRITVRFVAFVNLELCHVLYNGAKFRLGHFFVFIGEIVRKLSKN